MLRLLRISCVLLLLGGAVTLGRAFSLLGIFDVLYQTPAIGYRTDTGGYYNYSLLGGPMRLNEGYRWNIPVITYAFDASFVQFFGSNGLAAVDQAFALLNSVTTNLTGTSPNLTEFPLQSQRVNYQAYSLGIVDVKSQTLAYMMEQLGLAQPERFVATLRARTVYGDPAITNYVVFGRNYDPVTLAATNFVNGTLYSYQVMEFKDPDFADAIEFTPDPLAFPYSAVASGELIGGYFYPGVTRDDVGGLRYLYKTNSFHYEYLLPEVELAVTNTSAILTLSTYSLSDFITQTWDTTNGPAQIQALYPNLVFAGTNEYWTNLIQTNLTIYLTNGPWMPVGMPPILATNATYTTNFAMAYQYTFNNVVTNAYYTNGWVTLLTTEVGFRPWSPVGGPVVTNQTTETSLSNFVNGSIYILPATNFGFTFLRTQLVSIDAITNNLVSTTITNQPGTNTTSTNVVVFQTQVDRVTYFTNYSFAYYPIEWLSSTNTVGLRPGLGNFRFERVDYDSLIGSTFTPVTNIYTDILITKLQGSNVVSKVTQVARRRSTAPDILFLAEDLGLTGLQGIPIFALRSDTSNWQNNSALMGTGGAGPGVIRPQARLRFSNVAPYVINEAPYYVTGENYYMLGLAWGSFDGSTNAPIVYPENGGETLRWLEQQVFRPR